MMGNFNGNVLAQKKGQKAKKPDFQTLEIGQKSSKVGTCDEDRSGSVGS
jgi:hypothetical protein